MQEELRNNHYGWCYGREINNIPDTSHLVDQEQHFDLTPVTERVLISNSATRKWLKDFSSIGLKISHFIETLVSIYSTDHVEYTNQPKCLNNRNFMKTQYSSANLFMGVFTTLKCL